MPPVPKLDAVLQEEDFDLAQAALVAVDYAYPEMDPYTHLTELDRMADDVRPRLQDRGREARLDALLAYLFEEMGFHGNRQEYYDPRNSHLNQVIERRTGIPITLSLVVLEVGWRLDLPLVGVGMPGHFLVKWAGSGNELLVDPFDDGNRMSRRECQDRLDEIFEGRLELADEHLRAVSKREMLTRILNNLKKAHLERDEDEEALAVLDRLLTVNPYSFQDLRDRGLVLSRLGRDRDAVEALERYLELLPGAEDADEIERTIEHLRQAL